MVVRELYITIKGLNVLKGRPSKNHLIKKPFWYTCMPSCFVERCWFMRMLVMYPEIVTDKLNQ